jgi:hypothetical protein
LRQLPAPDLRRRIALAVATQVNDIPVHATTYGFRTTTFGTIIARSIMVSDLRQILAACSPEASFEDYAAAAIEQNVLGKPTASARRFGFRNLSEFYSLDCKILIFATLRDLWAEDSEAQPMLALLCATARDPILRAVTTFLLGLEQGTTVTPGMIAEEAERKFPGKFRPSPLQSLARNAASSWEQAGLLFGKRNKERSQPEVRQTSVTYALLLGDLCGIRGRALFSALWTRMLDAPEQLLRDHAAAAARQGWIEYRSAGDVIEVSFRHLMREASEVRP